jgi:t-SNARE complex subunit (syntaxin)
MRAFYPGGNPRPISGITTIEGNYIMSDIKLKATRQRLTTLLTRVTAESKNLKHSAKQRAEMVQLLEEFKAQEPVVFTVETDEEFETYSENLEAAMRHIEEGLANLSK